MAPKRFIIVMIILITNKKTLSMTSTPPSEATTSNKTQKTAMSAANLQSIIYSNEGGNEPKLSVLDQLLVPHEKTYIPIVDVEGAWSVIRLMQIRG